MADEKNKLRQVIVRAWGDEPVKIFLHRIDNNRCYVGSEDATKTIGLPFDQVFAFDSHMFSTMREAYESGESAKLAALYDSIILDDFACNRYQDNVDSPHDQEDIADSERTASSDGQ